MIRPVPGILAFLAVAAPLAALPNVQEFRLDTGLRCLLVESHEMPQIRMVLDSRWKRSELPPGKEGLAGLLARAMARGGAGPDSRAEFLRALDGSGIGFDFQARMGRFRWTVTTDSRSQEAAMELLTNAAVRPVLDGMALEAERQAEAQRAAAASPREQALDSFRWAIGAPGQLLPPGAGTLDHVEYQDLQDFRRRVIRPETATLVLYGDLNLAQARQLALLHLGIWGSADQAPLAAGAVKPAVQESAPARLWAALDSRPAELWVGAPRPRPDSGRAAEALLPLLLDRSARSRFGDLQTRFQLDPDGHGPLVIRTRAPESGRSRLVSAVAGALEALRRSGFTPEELAAARVQWQAGNQALSLHPARLADALLDGRLDPDLAQAVRSLDLEAANRALRAWLEPDRLRFLLLGADPGLVKAAEQAGFGPTVVAGGGL